eukprot:Rhum_TRINITY_DN2041_c0_g1::Rhum_TRINITY_DN2041_c0_g1_i1::g.5586::m.5586
MLSQLASLAVMYTVVRSVDFTDEFNANALRVTFVAVQSLVWAVLALIYFRAQMSGSKAKVQIPDQGPWGADPIDEKKEPVTIIVKDYHVQQLRQLATKLATSTAVIAVMHYKWELMPPLLMQCALNPQQVYQSTLFKIYVLGQNGQNFPPPWAQEKGPDFAKMLEGVSDPNGSKDKEASSERVLATLRKVNQKAMRKGN